MFPHHENEIAQSEAASGKTYANLWMHNGLVQMGSEKMSKSLGNFFTVRDVIKRIHPEVLRYFIISSHYRSPLMYNEATLENAHAALTRLYTSLRGLTPDMYAEDEKFSQRFHAAMDDDFNTPDALAVCFDVVREINKARDAGDLQAANRYAGILRRFAETLGHLEEAPETFLQWQASSASLSDEEINALMAAREQARANKAWDEADDIRDQLTSHGIVLEDTGGGTIWRRG